MNDSSSLSRAMAIVEAPSAASCHKPCCGLEPVRLLRYITGIYTGGRWSQPISWTGLVQLHLGPCVPPGLMQDGLVLAEAGLCKSVDVR